MSVSIPLETIKEIAQELDMGTKCFYHIPTGELESYPDELKGHAGFDEELWQESSILFRILNNSFTLSGIEGAMFFGGEPAKPCTHTFPCSTHNNGRI